jgi:hypothetical protein
MKQSVSEKKVFALAKPSGRKVVKIWVNEYRNFYRYDNLDSYNRKYLISKGYKLKKFKNIYGKTEKYLLKPVGNESLRHCFLVNDIFYYIKKLTNQVKMFHSAKPDIVFESGGDIYAIEVETGKSYRNAIKKLREKVKMLKQNYENNWFFVVTNRNLVKKYKKLGLTYEKRNIIKKINELFYSY